MGNYVNKSTLFLPAMLGYSQDKLGSEFRGCYINFDDDIVLLFKADVFTDSRFYKKEFKDKGVAYYFKVPDEYSKDFELFKKSKYSHFSTDLRIKIIELEGNTSLSSRIVCKSPDRRRYIEEAIGMELPTEAELLSALNLEEEIIV